MDVDYSQKDDQIAGTSNNKRPSDEPTPSPKRWREEPDMTMYINKCCPQCSKKFCTNYELDHHMQKEHPYKGIPIQVGGGLIKRHLPLTRSLYTGLINVYELDVKNNEFKDAFQFFETIFSELEFILNQELGEKKCLKISSELKCHFYKTSVDPVTMQMIVSDRTNPDPVFRGVTHSVYRSDSIRTIVNSLAWKMCNSVAAYINKKSGWILDFVSGFEISVGRFQPIGGTGFKTRNNLLKYVSPATVLSIDNTDPMTGRPDQNCFSLSILASKILPSLKAQYKEHVNRFQEKRFQRPLRTIPMSICTCLSMKKKMLLTNFNLLSKPTRTAKDKLQIKKEIRNSIYPLYSSNKIPQFRVKERILKHTHADTEVSNLQEIDIILILEETEQGWTGHYALIRNFNALISLTKNKSYCCKNCVNCFTSEDRLNEHRPNCLALGMQQVTMPEDKTYSFNKYGRMVHRAKRDDENVVARFFEDILKDQEIRQEEIESIQKEAKYNMKINPQLKKRLTHLIENDPDSLDPCYFCKKKLQVNPKDKTVFHHDHFSRQYGP
ncbi:hypothetical protein Fcan01_23195 [Folsomia candida]|uniref:C2H2-type domain-containing protein n=1 Tax=Folsomia candida TaxID=158441 RepID=A0A226D9W7_FOLCA|nr:hypothetical protein Fcan01_23195 [Folsomia candida]